MLPGSMDPWGGEKHSLAQRVCWWSPWGGAAAAAAAPRASPGGAWLASRGAAAAAAAGGYWLEQLASQAVSLRLIGPRLSYENCHKYMAAERWSSAPTSHS